MRKDIHPNYQEVLFHDTNADVFFLTRSTAKTKATREYEGKNTHTTHLISQVRRIHSILVSNVKLLLKVVLQASTNALAHLVAVARKLQTLLNNLHLWCKYISLSNKKPLIIQRFFLV